MRHLVHHTGRHHADARQAVGWPSPVHDRWRQLGGSAAVAPVPLIMINTMIPVTRLHVPTLSRARAKVQPSRASAPVVLVLVASRPPASMSRAYRTMNTIDSTIAAVASPPPP